MTRLAISLMAFAVLAAQPAELLARGGGGGRSFSGSGRSFSGGSHNFSGGSHNFSGGNFNAGSHNFSGGSRNFSGGNFGAMGEHTPSMSRSSSYNPGSRGAYRRAAADMPVANSEAPTLAVPTSVAGRRPGN